MYQCYFDETTIDFYFLKTRVHIYIIINLQVIQVVHQIFALLMGLASNEICIKNPLT